METTKDGEKSTDTLAELIVGIIVWGFFGQVAFLFFTKGTGLLLVSGGWWLGAMVAVFWAVHIHAGLRKVLALGMGDAQTALRFHAIIRYLVAAAGMALLYVSISLAGRKEMMIYAASYVPGILTLKAAAYTQPLIHRIGNSLFGK